MHTHTHTNTHIHTHTNNHTLTHTHMNTLLIIKKQNFNKQDGRKSVIHTSEMQGLTC